MSQPETEIVVNATVVPEVPKPSAPYATDPGVVTATTVAPVASSSPARNGPPPPPGCPEGGRWATIKYGGDKTLMLCLVLCFCCGILSLCGACAYLCPQDEKRVYVYGGNVYNSGGQNIGSVSSFTFV